MEMENVTNGMLYELIRDFKDDVNRRFAEMDKRFDGIDKRFEGVDRRFEGVDGKLEAVDAKFESMERKFDSIDARFESMERRFDQARLERMELREMILQNIQKLNEIYETRNHVSVSFSRAFAGVNLVVSALVSSVISLLLNR